MDLVAHLTNPEDNTKTPVTTDAFTIGRSVNCNFTVPLLPVSRYHCCINKVKSRWILRDQSSNGTLVNTKLYKFREFVALNPGDTIKLGPEGPTYHFTMEPPNIPPTEEINVPPAVQELEVKQEEVEEEVQAKRFKKDDEEPPDPIDDELTCSICSEIFLKAVTLNCSHSFCEYCINTWKKSKSTCPICRKSIATCTQTLVLDNYIDRIMKDRSDEEKERRKKLLEERDAKGKVKNEVVDLLDDTDSENGDDDEDFDNSDIDYSHEEYDEDDYDWQEDWPGPYYGGYGSCYSCGEQGHWANTCPHRRRRY